VKKINLFSAFAVLWILIFSIGADESFSKDLVSKDEALKKIFQQATSFESQDLVLSDAQINSIEEKAQVFFDRSYLRNIHMVAAKKDGQVLGFALEDTVIGKWGPIHYLVGLNTDGIIREVIVLDYQEIRGRPIAKKRFLRQYQKKNITDPIKLRSDIDGVTGATISSRSITDGIRKDLFIFQELKGTMNGL